jgi:hypothetical protein
MKIYRGIHSDDQGAVMVDGTLLTMKCHPYDAPNGRFEWGSHSPDAKRLARSILADCVGAATTVADFLVDAFAEDVVSRFQQQWEITSKDVEEWLRFKCQLGNSIQAATLGRKPSNPSHEPLLLPRLVTSPNYRLQNRL